MSIRYNILEAIKEDKDDFYYKCNDIEQELFALKDMTTNENTIKKLEAMILEFNNIRIEECSVDHVDKNLVEYTQTNRLKYKDEYGNTILEYNYAKKIMFSLIGELNKSFDEMYGYDFGFRIEGELIKLFDKNENFDYEDKNFSKVENITRKVIGNTDIYLEPENIVIMTIAGCRVK